MNNYFEIFETPQKFNFEKGLLKKKFYELSRKFHPDKYVTASAEDREMALQQATLINIGFKILNDDDQRMAYILKAEKKISEDEKMILEPGFLMEMMELNEMQSELEENLQNTELKSELENSINNSLEDWELKASTFKNLYDKGEQQELALNKLLQMYHQKKYLLRIKERMDIFATP